MIRPRTAGDLGRCETIAAAVQAVDGYPSFLGDDTLASFIAPRDAFGAWVAELEGVLAGQVVLRPRSAPGSVTMAADVLGTAPGDLAFVARLLVDPAWRRRGVARALLDHVVSEAHRLGRRTVLDVVDRDTAAVALYDAVGWRRLGSHTMTMRNGEPLHLHVYAEP